MSHPMEMSVEKSELRSATIQNRSILFIFRYPIQTMVSVLVVVIGTFFSVLPIERWERTWFLTILIYGVLAILLPLIAGFIYRKSKSIIPVILDILDLPEDQVITWLSGQFTFIFGNRSAYVVGIVCAVAAAWTTEVLGHPWQGMARILVLATLAILFAFIGMVGWSYLGLLLLLHLLQNKPVKGEPFKWPEDSFRKLNTAYLQIFLVGAFVYLVNAIGVWLSPGGQWLVFQDPVAQLWIFPIAGTVISFFIAFQYAIHRIMAQSKQRRLEHLNRLLTSQFEEWTADPIADKGRAVSDLIAWRDHIKKEQDWPLDFKSILLVISGLLLPTIKSIIDLANL